MTVTSVSPLQAVIHFHFDGQTLQARAGDSIAAALAEAGIDSTRRTRRGEPRGPYCCMGVCSECLVQVDGRRSQRACMVAVRSGMVVETQMDGAFAGSAPTDPPPNEGLSTDETSSSESLPTQSYDVVVIGAGPAGSSCALSLDRSGLSVALIDERHQAGGQYYKPRSAGFRGRFALDAQHRAGQALRNRLQESCVSWRAGETLWYARSLSDETGFELRSIDENSQHVYRAKAVILACGAYETPALVPGWTLPGVMTIGAGQALVRRYGVIRGQRILVAGNGPLGLQLTSELVRMGANVVALLERARPRSGWSLLKMAWQAPDLFLRGVCYRLHLMRQGVSILEGHELVRLAGDERVRTATYAGVGRAEETTIDVDQVFAGEGFAPQVEAARLLGCALQVDPELGQWRIDRDDSGRSSIPGVWVVGDGGGLQGARIAELQGQIAAAEIVDHLGQASSRQSALLETTVTRLRLRRARAFQTALWALYRAPARALPCDDTLVCRCETVSAGCLRNAIKQGAVTLGSLKGATRLGMGRCQGRYCIATAMRLLHASGHGVVAESLFAPQLPLKPVPIGLLKREKPEWAGHRDSQPAARPAIRREHPVSSEVVDLLVIGAGVTGLCAARCAAEAGASVMCIDRGVANGEASGGNAGSLHLQLLSWDFGSKAAGDGSAALATLALQQTSIGLWQALEAQFGADFEMQRTGGMMVAENPSQIDFLERKVRAEATVGVHSEVIDATRMQQIMPALSPRMVAAAWCPGEGKINPLLAGPVLARAARAAGVTLEERVTVQGIETRSGNAAYRVFTSHGTVNCRRIIIAAGGWSAGIGSMLGVSLPIRGAPLQMVVTEPAPPLVPCLLAHADRHLTLKQAKAGSLIIGGAWTAETSATGQARILADSLEGNLWVTGHTVPAARQLHVLRSWAAMNIDIDGAPLLGFLPGHPRVVVAATANGYTLGPLMGREAAAAVLKESVSPDLQRFGLQRFNRPAS